jgi:hypothetical protein
MPVIGDAHPDASSACRHAIALYNGERIVYGVGGCDATRVRHDAIAMTRGTPAAGGVLSALGHDLATTRVGTVR